MNLNNLKYTQDHEWIRIDGDIAYVGITDFAQGELGDIVYVEIESLNENVRFKFSDKKKIDPNFNTVFNNYIIYENSYRVRVLKKLYRIFSKIKNMVFSNFINFQK